MLGRETDVLVITEHFSDRIRWFIEGVENGSAIFGIYLYLAMACYDTILLSLILGRMG